MCKKNPARKSDRVFLFLSRSLLASHVSLLGFDHLLYHITKTDCEDYPYIWTNGLS